MTRKDSIRLLEQLRRLARPRWFLIPLILATLAVSSRFLPIEHWVLGLSQWAKTAGALGQLAFAGLNVLVLLVCFWGTPLTIASGVAFGPFWGFAISWLASGLGISLPFFIARYLARQAVQRRVEHDLRFRAVDLAVRQNGWKVALLLRLNPLIPFGLSNYAFGLTAISFRDYLFGSMIAMIPGTIFYVYLGYAGRLALTRPHEGLSLSGFTVIGGGVIFTILFCFYLTRLANRAIKSLPATPSVPD